MAELKKVTQIIDLIEVGVTFPIRCRLSDGSMAVVKYQRNPVGTASLINEFIGNCIADSIGLTIPEFGLCELSLDVIKNANPCEEIGPENSGIAFYSKIIDDSVPVTPILLKHASNKETEKVLLFDQFIKNDDRHIGNLIAEITSKRRIFFIDCSHFLTNSGNLNIPLDVSREVEDAASINPRLFDPTSDINGRNVYSLLCSMMGYDEKKLITEKEIFCESLDNRALEYFVNMLPSEWLNERTRKRVNDMIVILEARLGHIDKICEKIAVERRNHIWIK